MTRANPNFRGGEEGVLKFLPVLTGSDINVYAQARSFHELYGLRSVAYSAAQLVSTAHSRIVDVHPTEHFTQPEVFIHTMLQAGKRLRAQYPDHLLLLIAGGDAYADLISQFCQDLAQYFTFSTISLELSRQLTRKDSFYQICKEYGLDFPKTWTFSAEDVASGKHLKADFPFPLAMKAADSVEWLRIRFPGRQKAWILHNRADFISALEASYQAGYSGTMVVQDYVPGGDTTMRVLNAYVDQGHNVRMMALGHVLIEDHSPGMVGNYGAIRTEKNQELVEKVANFLQAIKYQGVANFDFKYDQRDGKFKVFELNPRLGASSFFAAANGEPLIKYFVEELVEGKPFSHTAICDGDKLWANMPAKTLVKYLGPGPDRQWVLEAIRSGRLVQTLNYKPDLRHLARRLIVKKIGLSTQRNYQNYYPENGKG